MAHPTVTQTFQTKRLSWVALRAPVVSGAMVVSRAMTLLAPRMAADAASGRLSLALGRCTYSEDWTLTTNSGGASSLVFKGLSSITPVGVVFCASGFPPSASPPALLPWTQGHDCGAPIPANDGATPPVYGKGFASPDTSNCLMPDGLLVLDQQGLVWLAVGGYGRLGDSAPGVPDPRNYALRLSSDLGHTWTDGLNGAEDAALAHTNATGGAYDASSPSYWGTWALDRIAALMTLQTPGHRGAERTVAPTVRPLDLTAGVSPPPPDYAPASQDSVRLQNSVLYGATGYAETQGGFMCVHRHPLFLLRGAAGPFASFHAAYNDPSTKPLPLPTDDLGRSITDAQTITYDEGLTVSVMAAPAVGAVDDTLTGIPGYPFPGNYAPHFLGAWNSNLSDGKTPAVSYGAMEWARGDAQSGTLHLVSVASMHRPTPRASFTWDAGSNGHNLEDGFQQYTDTPQTATSGRDFGHHTCITITSTHDGGASWGDLRVLRDGAGAVVLADTADARVAAASLRGGRLVVCLCTGGAATLYVSGDEGETWVVLGASHDGGLTWT